MVVTTGGGSHGLITVRAMLKVITVAAAGATYEVIAVPAVGVAEVTFSDQTPADVQS